MRCSLVSYFEPRLLGNSTFCWLSIVNRSTKVIAIATVTVSQKLECRISRNLPQQLEKIFHRLLFL